MHDISQRELNVVLAFVASIMVSAFIDHFLGAMLGGVAIAFLIMKGGVFLGRYSLITAICLAVSGAFIRVYFEYVQTVPAEGSGPGLLIGICFFLYAVWRMSSPKNTILVNENQS